MSKNTKIVIALLAALALFVGLLGYDAPRKADCNRDRHGRQC